MILGIGHDLVDMRRIGKLHAQFGQRFLSRTYTSVEQAYAATKADPVPALARRFAAKEACAKALGSGIGQSAFLCEIGVVKQPSGQPGLVLTGRAATRLSSLIPQGHHASLHLSLSDDWPFASAFVIIEAVKMTENGE